MLSEPNFIVSMRGYDPATVNELVDRIIKAADSPDASLRAQVLASVEAADFPVVPRGYKRRRVTAYLKGARAALAP